MAQSLYEAIVFCARGVAKKNLKAMGAQLQRASRVAAKPR
jgi:hypothetical protein